MSKPKYRNDKPYNNTQSSKFASSTQSAGSLRSPYNKGDAQDKKNVAYDQNEIFCYLAVEEFLMKKQMHGTLRQFREEWRRPDQVPKLTNN